MCVCVSVSVSVSVCVFILLLKQAFRPSAGRIYLDTNYDRTLGANARPKAGVKGQGQGQVVRSPYPGLARFE